MIAKLGMDMDGVDAIGAGKTDDGETVQETAILSPLASARSHVLAGWLPRSWFAPDADEKERAIEPEPSQPIIEVGVIRRLGAETVEFLVNRGIPVMGHVGLTPQAVNVLGGYGARGRSEGEAGKIVRDARMLANAGVFAIVVEGVIEPIAEQVTGAVPCPTIGIGASARCDGQVLVTVDMLGMFERVPRFVKRYEALAETISAAVATYAPKSGCGRFRARSKPTAPNRRNNFPIACDLCHGGG